jgi:hypothetical protein
MDDRRAAMVELWMSLGDAFFDMATACYKRAGPMKHEATLRFNPPAFGVALGAKYKYDYICQTCGAEDYSSSKCNLLDIIEADHSRTGVNIDDQTRKSA